MSSPERKRRKVESEYEKLLRLRDEVGKLKVQVKEMKIGIQNEEKSVKECAVVYDALEEKNRKMEERLKELSVPECYSRYGKGIKGFWVHGYHQTSDLVIAVLQCLIKTPGFREIIVENQKDEGLLNSMHRVMDELWNEKFSHVTVDEFVDINSKFKRFYQSYNESNPIQYLYALLSEFDRLLVGKMSQLMAVTSMKYTHCPYHGEKKISEEKNFFWELTLNQEEKHAKLIIPLVRDGNIEVPVCYGINLDLRKHKCKFVRDSLSALANIPSQVLVLARQNLKTLEIEEIFDDDCSCTEIYPQSKFERVVAFEINELENIHYIHHLYSQHEMRVPFLVVRFLSVDGQEMRYENPLRKDFLQPFILFLPLNSSEGDLYDSILLHIRRYKRSLCEDHTSIFTDSDSDEYRLSQEDEIFSTKKAEDQSIYRGMNTVSLNLSHSNQQQQDEYDIECIDMTGAMESRPRQRHNHSPELENDYGTPFISVSIVSGQLKKRKITPSGRLLFPTGISSQMNDLTSTFRFEVQVVVDQKNFSKEYIIHQSPIGLTKFDKSCQIPLQQSKIQNSYDAINNSVSCVRFADCNECGRPHDMNHVIVNDKYVGQNVIFSFNRFNFTSKSKYTINSSPMYYYLEINIPVRSNNLPNEYVLYGILCYDKLGYLSYTQTCNEQGWKWHEYRDNRFRQVCRSEALSKCSTVLFLFYTKKSALPNNCPSWKSKFEMDPIWGEKSFEFKIFNSFNMFGYIFEVYPSSKLADIVYELEKNEMVPRGTLGLAISLDGKSSYINITPTMTIKDLNLQTGAVVWMSLAV